MIKSVNNDKGSSFGTPWSESQIWPGVGVLHYIERNIQLNKRVIIGGRLLCNVKINCGDLEWSNWNDKG